MLDLSATLTEAVFVYLCICVFVFVYLHVRHLGILFFRSSYYYLFKNIAHVRSICNFHLNCICVFVFLYLDVRHLETLFLRSSYHYLFKNITHVRSIFNLTQTLFVYLLIARQTIGNIVFEVLVCTMTF